MTEVPEPEDLPFTTAPEYVDEIVADLNLEAHVVDEAREWARRYGLEDPISNSPKVIAAAAIYVSGMLNGQKRDQATLVEVADIGTTHSITVAYRRMMIEDGYDIDPPAVDQETKSEAVETETHGFLGRVSRLLVGGERL